MLGIPMPEYFFAVARQPDIIDTTDLDDDFIQRSITIHIIDTSVSTRVIQSGADATSPAVPSQFTCTTASTELELDGELSAHMSAVPVTLTVSFLPQLAAL